MKVPSSIERLQVGIVGRTDKGLQSYLIFLFHEIVVFNNVNLLISAVFFIWKLNLFVTQAWLTNSSSIKSTGDY